VGALRRLSVNRQHAETHLSATLGATDEPEAPMLIELLQAIIKNLMRQPTTRQNVTELERYLQTDEIIADAKTPNPFGIEITLRKPLRPLQPLREAFDG
jgi:hypothetical protein